jgi:transcriptional regulator with XRE-family HTH domain
MTNLSSEQYASPEPLPRAAFSFASAPTPSAARQRLGERVRMAREAAHLTQEELAGTTYSKSYISAVERGKMTPSFQALRLLAERLNVTRSYLLGEEVRSESPEAPEKPAGDEQQATLRSLAEQLLHQGRHEEAIALFERIGQKDQTSWARERYACFLADQGRFQEAYEQMQRVLRERHSSSK